MPALHGLPPSLVDGQCLVHGQRAFEPVCIGYDVGELGKYLWGESDRALKASDL